MLDGLSFAASVAGLVSLTDIVVTKGYKYIKTVKDCEEEVRNLIVEADVLCGVLTRLTKLIKEDEEADETDLELALENDYVHECQKTLREINRVLAEFERKAAKQPENEANGDGGSSNAKKRSIFSRLSRADLKWPLSRSKTMELIERLERHKSTCIMGLAAGEVSAMLQVLGQQKITNQQLAEIRSEQRKSEEIRLAQELGEQTKKILDWLSPVSPLQNHQTARSLYQKGTGRWFIDSPDFDHWTKTKNSAIWLYGIPGAGKTILASLVIEEVFSLQDNSVAYYYCDYKNATSQESTNILGSLVKQLSLQKARAIARVNTFYAYHHPAGKPATRPTEQDFGILLQDVSKDFPEVTIIIDGLDECGSSPGIDRSGLVRILSTLHDAHAGSIRIAITSRRERDIEERFGTFTKVSIAAMSLDLELYVASEVGQRTEAGKLRIRDESLKGEIIETLVNGADGMFQWVKCQLDYLCCLPNDTERRRALKELPPDLPATYVRILERLNRTLPPKTQIYLKRVLKWLVLNNRSNRNSVITLPALAQAISIEDEHTRLQKDSIPDERDIIEWCSSLVRKNSDMNALELSHFTVKEFLLSDKLLIESLVARQYLVDKSTDFTYLAKTCLAYLGLDDFCVVMDLNDDSSDLECNFPFYHYAATSFFDYLNIPQLEAQADLQLCRIFTPKVNEKFFLWRQYFVPRSFEITEGDIHWEPGFEINLTPLHLACDLLLKKTTERLLREGADPNATCTYFGTPLSRIVVSGHDLFTAFGPMVLCSAVPPLFANRKGERDYKRRVCDILLSNGADISLGSLLCVALGRQDDAILSHLLSKGVANSPVETCFGSDCERLVYMLEEQMDWVVHEGNPSPTIEYWKDFLKYMMDLNSPFVQDARFLSIMHEFLSKGSEFKKENAKTKEGKNTVDQQFRLACRIGNEPAVVRLLTENASVDALDSENRSALYLALEGGFWSIAFILLQAGADLNARSWGITPLEMVMELEGDDEFSRGIDGLAFVDQMAESNHLDIFAREAPRMLRVACEYIRKDIIQFILEHDINVNANVLTDGSAPIHALLTNELICEAEDALGILLEHGADINLQDVEGRTPLHLACGAGFEESVKLLLAENAETNCADQDGNLPLHLAAMQGTLDLVRLLLDHGANRNKSNAVGWTPLHSACKFGHLDVIKCLLEHEQGRTDDGTNGFFPDASAVVRSGINLPTEERDTPLSLALMSSNAPNLSVVELLLPHGASTNSILSSGQTVLYDFLSKLAPTQEQLDIASFLLEADNLKALGGEFLAKSARDGKFEVSKCLLTRAKTLGIDLEMDPSARDAVGWGLSHYASCECHGLGEFLPLLLKMSGNSLSTTKYGISELYLAAFTGNEIGLWLALACVNSGQFIDSTTATGLTPLHTALGNHHISVASILLENGASPNIPDYLGRTPLFTAVDVGSHEGVSLLLSRLGRYSRLTMEIPCSYGVSTFHLAEQRGDLTIIRMLIENGAKPDILEFEGGTIFQPALKSEDALALTLPTENCPVGAPNTAIPLPPNTSSTNEHTEQPAFSSLLETAGVGQNFQFAGLDTGLASFNVKCQDLLQRSTPRPRSKRVQRLPLRHRR